MCRAAITQDQMSLASAKTKGASAANVLNALEHILAMLIIDYPETPASAASTIDQCADHVGKRVHANANWSSLH